MMPLLTKDPYPALLGIEWAYQNDAIINLKRMKNEKASANSFYILGYAGLL